MKPTFIGPCASAGPVAASASAELAPASTVLRLIAVVIVWSSFLKRPAPGLSLGLRRAP
jgi:hypothetical protein